jgi:hypothetical protein
MARRTFADFDAELLLALGNRTDFDAGKRGFVLDSAYTYVANAIRHPELEVIVDRTLLTATDFITLPDDFWFPELVKNVTDEQELEPREVRTTEAVTKPVGNPSIYVRWANTLLFDRKPSVAKTIRIWYTKRPAEPGANTSSILDSLYDQLIILFAIKFGLEELRDYTQAALQDRSITAYSTRLKVPWRMTRTDHRGAGVQVRMR